MSGEDEKFRCRECSSEFKSNSELDQHLKQEHGMGSRWKSDTQLRP